jgi:hypothetical protein
MELLPQEVGCSILPTLGSARSMLNASGITSPSHSHGVGARLSGLSVIASNVPSKVRRASTSKRFSSVSLIVVSVASAASLKRMSRCAAGVPSRISSSAFRATVWIASSAVRLAIAAPPRSIHPEGEYIAFSDRGALHQRPAVHHLADAQWPVGCLSAEGGAGNAQIVVGHSASCTQYWRSRRRKRVFWQHLGENHSLHQPGSARTLRCRAPADLSL